MAKKYKTYKRSKGRLYKRIKIRSKKTGRLYTRWKDMGKTARQRSVAAKAAKSRRSRGGGKGTQDPTPISQKEKMKSLRYTQEIPKGTTLVSSGGRVWYKGYKQYGTFGSSTTARQHTMLTYEKKGRTFTPSGFATSAETKTAAEYWWQKQRQREREKSKAYRAALALQQAATSKTRASFITGEKTAIETEMQRRYTLLGSRRRGPRTAALTKSRREAWGKKLAESRRYEGETWFDKIPSILGTSQAASPSSGRRITSRILRELNGTKRRKSPKRTPTRKKTGGQVL